MERRDSTVTALISCRPVERNYPMFFTGTCQREYQRRRVRDKRGESGGETKAKRDKQKEKRG